MTKKLNLHELRANRDKGITTKIPTPAEGMRISPNDVAKINASDFMGTKEPDMTKDQQKEVTVGQIDSTKVPHYVMGKKYVPKTDRNIATYAKIAKALADGPKTLAELTKAVEDHKDFVGYMVRGGHIVVQQAEA